MKEKNNTESRNVSISDIAEACGVSSMTVSRALRGSSTVKEETRQKIIIEAEKIGYHRQVKSGRPLKIDVKNRPAIQIIVGTFGRSMVIFYSELITAIEQQLSQRGCDCIIRTYNGDYNHFIHLKETLRVTTTVSATLIIGYFNPEQLKGILDIIPDALLLDNPGDDSIDLPYESISFDNAEAAKLGVRKIIDTGRKKIVLVKGLSDHYFSREIDYGYRQALKTAGIPVNEDLIIETDFTMESAAEALNILIEKKVDFDAVFTNDEMACGVYRALQGRGLKIPDDVAVCGCDGIPLGAQLTPPLTTIMLDYREMGERAVEHLFSHQTGKYNSPCRIKLLPSMKIRESI